MAMLTLALLCMCCRYVLFENAMSIVKLNAVIAGAPKLHKYWRVMSTWSQLEDAHRPGDIYICPLSP